MRRMFGKNWILGSMALAAGMTGCKSTPPAGATLAGSTAAATPPVVTSPPAVNFPPAVATPGYAPQAGTTPTAYPASYTTAQPAGAALVAPAAPGYGGYPSTQAVPPGTPSGAVLPAPPPVYPGAVNSAAVASPPPAAPAESSNPVVRFFQRFKARQDNFDYEPIRQKRSTMREELPYAD